MSKGYAVLMDINGKKADFSKMPKGFKKPQNLASAGVYQQENHKMIQAMANNARKPTV